MAMLGVSAFHRDAAAVLLVDGVPVAAAREESFSGELHDAALPLRAARHCLRVAGLVPTDLEQVVFQGKPLRAFERVLVSTLRAFPRSGRPFARGVFQWLGDRLWVRDRLAAELGLPRERVLFVDRARAHAAAAFLTSPFERASVLVLDDIGDWTTTLLAQGEGSEITALAELSFPHSLGMVASAVTQFLGFEPGSDEALVEDLAAWGTPRHAAALGALLPAAADGSFQIDAHAFRFPFDPDQLVGPGLSSALGQRRSSRDPLLASGDDRRHADVAASLQAVLEERALALAHELHRRHPGEHLCVGGALAANARLVARLADDGPFASVFAPAAPGEDGAALGAALMARAASHAGADLRAGARTRAPGPGLGSQPSSTAKGAIRPSTLEPDAVQAALVRRLAAHECLAWARGELPMGSDPGGARLLLSHPDSGVDPLATVRGGTSERVPRYAVPAEQAADWFVLPGDRALHPGAFDPLARSQPGSTLPAAPDGSVRLMPVHRDDDPELHALLLALDAAGHGCVLRAEAFRPRGAPAVRSERDAVAAFERSTLHALLAGPRLYARE